MQYMQILHFQISALTETINQTIPGNLDTNNSLLPEEFGKDNYLSNKPIIPTTSLLPSSNNEKTRNNRNVKLKDFLYLTYKKQMNHY